MNVLMQLGGGRRQGRRFILFACLPVCMRAAQQEGRARLAGESAFRLCGQPGAHLPQKRRRTGKSRYPLKMRGGPLCAPSSPVPVAGDSTHEAQ